MSYMDLPRFHILGDFYADPSTQNNDPSNYDPKNTRPAPWQEPSGLHHFKFTTVTVTGGLDSDGKNVAGDSLMGASIRSGDKPSPAKLVDLDVYQQGVPTIYGFTLEVALPDNAAMNGTMDRCALNGLRFSRILPTRGWQDWDDYGQASFGGDTYAAGTYQTLLRFDAASWPAESVSPLLAQLRVATTTDTDGKILVSFRFVLDSYQNVPWHPDVRKGRVVGSLGPVIGPHEPAQIPGGRWLSPRQIDRSKAPWYWPDFYASPCKTADRGKNGKTLVIDLANALAIQRPRGAPVDLGDLTVEFGDGSSGIIGSFQANESLYNELGGIIELPLTDAQWAARRSPIRLSTTRDDIGGPVLWGESTPGRNFAVETRVFSLACEEDSDSRTASSRVHVTEWGEPAVGVQLEVIVVSVVNGIQGATVPWSAGYEGNTAEASGALEARLASTDDHGFANLELTVVKDPGFRTEFLDGQLYFVVVYDPADGEPDLFKAPVPQEHQLSCVVFSGYKVNKNPTWEEIQRLMAPYARLYPGMEEKIDLVDEQSFFTFGINPPWALPPPHPAIYHPSEPYKLPDGKTIAAGAIPYFMTRPIDDPRYMPISRDLSPNRVLTVLYYVYNLLQQGQTPQSKERQP